MSYVFPRKILNRAHRELDAACHAEVATEKFLHAHMAALRGASAVVAALPSVPLSDRARRRVRSVWVQLTEIEAGPDTAASEPSWSDWAEYYTASATTRAALESGQLRGLDPQLAAQAVAVATRFLGVVEAALVRHERQLAAPYLAKAS